ncbi:unnamed protein product [Ambrosiozyma monospora]|uniref:Unnamed protein product n=1 Tax=Ambrosiozyma monospora TaxID=43982 RepID=A0ACB5TQ24_AMBMO|nr:unnamed protein product [Ambrosiozyma monospora]
MDVVCCYHHLMVKLQLTSDVSIKFSVALNRIIEEENKALDEHEPDTEPQSPNLFFKSFTKFQFKSLQFSGYLVDSRTNESFILMREIIDMMITKLNPKHVSLKLSGMSILPSLQWSNYITELYDLRSGDLKMLVEKLPRFKKLKIVNVNKKAFSDSFDLYQLDQLLSHSTIEKCIFAPRGPLPYSIQVDLVTLVSKMDSKLELHLANFFLPLDNSTFTLLTNATEITDFNLVPRLMYTTAEYTQFNLFGKIENIRSLHVKIPDIKDIVLRNDTLEDLKITFSYCSNIDLSGLSHLRYLNFESQGLQLDQDTINTIPESVKRLEFNTKIGKQLCVESIGLPRQLLHLGCLPDQLPLFKLKSCPYIRSLTLYMTQISEDDEIWNYIPNTVSFLKLSFNPEANDHSTTTVLTTTPTSPTTAITNKAKLAGLNTLSMIDLLESI